MRAPRAASLSKTERLILMNGGIRLAVEGSASLADPSKLAIRRVSNMYEISGMLLKGSVLSI